MKRRTLLAAGAFAPLPRVAIAQADQRPTLTLAVQKISNSNTFETPREQSNVGYRLSPSFAETLIDSDWTGGLKPVPGLATGWRRIDDHTVEFELRPNVRFHDGRVMTAEDVAWSFGPRLFGPNLSGNAEAERPAAASPVTAGATGREPPPEVPAVARRTFPGLERIEIVRDGVVRFVNRVPDVTLEGRIQQNVGVILSRAAFEGVPNWLAWARAPVGTGPYRIGEFRPDVSLVLEAHDEYWGGRPPARRIRLVEIPEVASRVNALLSGEVDLACDMPPDQVATVERNPRFEVLGSPINNIRILAFDQKHPQLANPLMRRALSHAIDQKTIVEALWSGRTRIPQGMQLPFFGEMFHADWTLPAFDPAEARRLAREAGYRGEPIPYRLLNNYYTNQTANAQIMVEMWRAAGLNVTIEMRENWNQVQDRSQPRGLFDWSNTQLFNDPVSGLVRGFGPRSEADANGYWKNDAFNELAGVLNGSTDRALRRAAFGRMLQIAEREDPAYIVLHQAATFTAKRRDISWRASDGWAMDFRAGNLRFGT
jgi:peptide/nickel transport system substrate-binding protein